MWSEKITRRFTLWRHQPTDSYLRQTSTICIRHHPWQIYPTERWVSHLLYKDHSCSLTPNSRSAKNLVAVDPSVDLFDSINYERHGRQNAAADHLGEWAYRTLSPVWDTNISDHSCLRKCSLAHSKYRGVAAALYSSMSLRTTSRDSSISWNPLANTFSFLNCSRYAPFFFILSYSFSIISKRSLTPVWLAIIKPLTRCGIATKGDRREWVTWILAGPHSMKRISLRSRIRWRLFWICESYPVKIFALKADELIRRNFSAWSGYYVEEHLLIYLSILFFFIFCFLFLLACLFS